jgi:hypothetical protein
VRVSLTRRADGMLRRNIRRTARAISLTATDGLAPVDVTEIAPGR